MKAQNRNHWKRPGQVGALVLSLLWVVSCAGRGTAPQAPALPPVDDDLMNLLPAHVELAAWLDLGSLRTSVLGPLIDSLIRDEDLVPAPGSALFQDTDEVLLGVVAGQGGEPDQFVVLFKGSFDPAKASQLIAHSYSSNDPVPLRALTDRTMAAGTLPLLDAVSALARREGDPLRTDERFSDFGLGSETVVLRYRKGPSAPALPAMFDISSMMRTEDVTTLDARLAVGKTISVVARAQMSPPESAERTAKKMNRERRSLKGNMLVVLMGVGFLLDRISVKAEDAELLISIELDEAGVGELAQLVERIDKIRQLLSSGDQ